MQAKALRNPGFFCASRIYSLEIQLIRMSCLKVVQHDVEIVRRQYTFAAGCIQMVLIVCVRGRTRWRTRRRVRLFVLVRQLHARHPDGASRHVLVRAVRLTRTAGRCKKKYMYIREIREIQRFIGRYTYEMVVIFGKFSIYI